jgi:hypothetical protein
MTKEEYFSNLAVTAITELVELDKKVKNFAGASDVDCSVHADIQDWFGVNGDESTDIYNVRLNDAYDAYVESCEEKEHNFEVSFSVSASGRVTVRAKDEYDAQEYVENNIEVEDNGDGVNVYMCDDECVTEDIELDNSSWSLDDVTDEGEVED